jgi:hypothetical protein
VLKPNRLRDSQARRQADEGEASPSDDEGDCFSQRACNDANAAAKQSSAAKRLLRKDRTLTFVV